MLRAGNDVVTRPAAHAGRASTLQGIPHSADRGREADPATPHQCRTVTTVCHGSGD